MDDFKKEALELHLKHKGKIEVRGKVSVKTPRDLSLAYSPGVAEPCKEIAENEEMVNEYTARGNLVAVVSTGTAVLGLGDIGPKAALPVMEGKCVLFKDFAGIDAFPLCIGTKEIDEVVNFVKLLEPTFAGINLEDIAAPDCFEIERRLKEETGMAIFHDDQHGTAIVTLAGIINSLRFTGKKLGDIRIVVNGAGASAIATLKLLINAGARNSIICDSRGTIFRGRTERMNKEKEELAQITNPENIKGGLEKAMEGADVFIGLSIGDVVSEEMVRSMNSEPLIFALANPTPEIMPEKAKKAGARIVGTGRSDYPNQINNVLAFPGVMRGALDVRATDINEEMKVAAAEAIAELVGDDLREDRVIPEPFDERVAPAVAGAVGKAAMGSGVARLKVDPQDIIERTKKMVKNQ